MSRHKNGYTLTRNEHSEAGKIIEQRRMELNLSIWQVACLTKLSESTIRLLECRGVANACVGTLLSVCDVLNLDPMNLIEADTGKSYGRLQ